MDEALNRLAERVKIFLSQVESLKQGHLQLQASNQTLQKQAEQLLAKNELAVNQLEKMMSRLKSLERSL